MSSKKLRNSHAAAKRSLVMLTAAAAAAIAYFASPMSANAQVLTWDPDPAAGPQDGSGNWDLATTNWWNGSTNVVWPNGTQTAVFGAGTPGAYTVSVTGNTTIGGITFNTDAYTLAGAGTLNVTGATPITLNAATGTISTVVTGAGSLNILVASTSTLTLGSGTAGGTLSYTGGTTLGGGGTIELTRTGTTAILGTGSITLSGIALRYGNNTGITVPAFVTTGTTNVLSLAGNGTFGAGTPGISGGGTLIHEARNVGGAGIILTLQTDNSAFTGTLQTNGTLRFRHATAGSANAVFDLGTTGTTGVAFITGNVTIQLGAVMGSGGTMTSNIRSGDGATNVTYQVGGRNIDTTFGGVIRDENTTNKFTAVTKVGTGRWTLGGASYYTGNTTINGGTLALSSTGTLAVDLLGTPLGTPRVFVNSGAAFDVSAVPGGYNVPTIQTLTGNDGTIYGNVNVGAAGSGAAVVPNGDAAAGTLTFANNLTLGGGTFRLDFGAVGVVGSGSNDLINVGGTLTLGSGTILATPIGAVNLGNYPLIRYGGVAGSLGNITLAAGTRATMSLVQVPGGIDLSVTGTGNVGNLAWRGNSGSNWDVGGQANWFNSNPGAINPDRFYQADNVTFDNTGGVPTTVTLVGSLFPTSLVVNSNDNNFTFTGSGTIGGDVGLVKSGSSTLTLSQTGANTYTGGTRINAGAIVLATAQSSLGSGSVTFAGAGGTLSFFSSFMGNALNVTAPAALVFPDGVQTYSGEILGNSTLTLYVAGTSNPSTLNGPMGTFTGTLSLAGMTGTVRLNSSGDNINTGSPDAVFDLGNNAVTFGSRNGATINFGALMGGPNATLVGTVGTIANASTYVIGAKNLSTTYSGNIADGGGTANITKVGTAILTLTGTNTYTGTTTVQAGKLVLGTNAQAPVLTGGGADVQGGRLIFDYVGGSSPASTVLSILDAGYDQSPKFSTGQIRTSNAPATDRGLGWVDNTGAQQIIVAYTWYGDTNLDGQVDITDLGALATAWQTAGVWANGDCDYSGWIDITDLGMLATNWQQGVGNPLGPESFGEALAALGLPNVSVPEPAAIGLIGLCLVGVTTRRARRAIAAA